MELIGEYNLFSREEIRSHRRHFRNLVLAFFVTGELISYGITKLDYRPVHNRFSVPRTIELRVSRVEPELARTSADTVDFMIFASDGTCAIYQSAVSENPSRPFQLYGKAKVVAGTDKPVFVHALGLSTKGCYVFDNLTPEELTNYAENKN